MKSNILKKFPTYCVNKLDYFKNIGVIYLKNPFYREDSSTSTEAVSTTIGSEGKFSEVLFEEYIFSSINVNIGVKS